MGKVLKVVAIVAAIAVIVFAPQLIPQIIGSALIASAVTAVVVAAASFALSTLLAPKPSTQSATPQVFRQSIANSFIVYGKRRVGGLLVFFHSKKHTDGKHYRYFVIAVAGHRCKGVVSWMLGDDVVTVDGSGMVTSGPYASAAWLWFVRGTDSDVANATFVSECGGKWTTNHKGLGVAKIYAKFRMNDDVIEAGMPNITAVIEGRDEIYDPRDDSTDYTNNAALVFYDWMKLPREEGGFGAYDDEIPDDDYISAQANVCDETVEGEARYAHDGVITTGAAPSEIRDTLVSNCAGSYTFSEGKHLLRVGYWTPPSETLTEGQLSGPIQVKPFSTNDVAANEIQGTFYDPDNLYQPVAFTTKTTDPAPADIKQLDLDMPFITSRYRAERIATIMLRRAGAEKTVAWPMNIEGVKIAALDVVQLDTARYGLSNYAFVVQGWQLSADYTVLLNLKEENEEIYADPVPTTPDTVPDIDVPEPLPLDRDISVLIANSWTEPTYVLSAVESGGSVELTVIDHERVYPDGLRTSITGGTFTGLDPDTAYIPYYDDATRVDGTPVIVINEDISEAQYGFATGRHSLGRILTPGIGTGETFEGGGVYPTGSTIGAEIPTP